MPERPQGKSVTKKEKSRRHHQRKMVKEGRADSHAAQNYQNADPSDEPEGGHYNNEDPHYNNEDPNYNNEDPAHYNNA